MTDPAVQQALARLAELSPLHGAKDELLVPLLAASPFLGRFLLAHPETLTSLAELPPSRDKDAWLAFLASRAPRTEPEARFAERLRVARHEAFVAIGVRELVTGDPIATGVMLSAFAAAVLEHALAYAEHLMAERYGVPRTPEGTRCGAVVLGMGELGGEELSFGSELDLVYAYSGDQGATDGARGLGAVIDLHTYHSRLFAKLTQLVSEPGDEGLVFRVDLDARPEGRTGPLCNSAEALERYYESFGHDGERLAWIKARPVAGDLALGARIVSSLEPFVFRRHLDYGFAEDVLAMKRRIDQSSARLGQKPGFNVKLGRGGLRELAFAVQTLQLAWGGRLPDLRARHTPMAIQRLALAGLVDQAEADGLLGAYRFLRRVEHLLQLEEDGQSRVLPVEAAGRRKVATLVMPGDGDASARFEIALDDHRKRVRAAFDGVFASAERERAASAIEGQLDVALDLEAEPEGRDEALMALGFVRAELARSRLDALARRPESPFHPKQAAGAHGDLGRKILLAVAHTPDPDAALSHVDGLLRALRHRRAALDQLDEDPRRLTALANLFGTSHYLSRLLVRSPGLLDRLVFDGKEPIARTRHDMARLLDQEIVQVAQAAGGEAAADLELVLTAARRFQTAEILRIGFFDLAGLVEEPGGQLSDVAEVIVCALVRAVRRDLADKMGRDVAAVPPLSAVALGDFGARELTYGAPLELAFVVPDDADPALALRMSRAVVTALSVSSVEGVLYRLDARQRPTGTQGPLSVAASRWRDHHFGDPAAGVPARAEVWEHEIVLHARVIGDAPASIQALVTELREHAIEVLASDVTASPLSALEGLTKNGLVPGSDAQALSESRRFLRRLDNRLAIVQEVEAESHALLGADPATWSASDRDHMRRLALRMGYGDRSERAGAEAAIALYKDVQRHRKVVADVGARLAQIRAARVSTPPG